MLNLDLCLELVNNELELLKTLKRQPNELYEPINYILSLGGKRIRPALAIMACNLYTDSVQSAIKPAAAIEVFHNFTLVHDDIMDNAILRRNKTTVHTKWNNNVAILSGDAMQILAYSLVCECDKAIMKPLLDVFNSTALEVCEGQQYDMNFSTIENVSIKEYMRMIELKTSVLIAASLKIGAICGKANETESQTLYEFGRYLGLAFQIQDDYLDVYADSNIFGKTLGGDITENKKTFLLVKAMELANEKQAICLKQLIQGNYTEPSDKINRVKKIFEELNIPQITHNQITEYANKAFAYLDLVKVSDDRKIFLREVAKDLMERDK